MTIKTTSKCTGSTKPTKRILIITPDIILWIRTALRLVHFAGIILGVGAATLLDLIILRFALIKRIIQTDIRIIVFSSKIIAIGLALLWFSGIGFLIYYSLFDPSKLDNPKLIAKIIIVATLTLNALLVHFFVLPQINIQIGQYLLQGLSAFHRFLLVLIGSISAISWYVPLILGIVPQFNNVVPAEIILAAYATLVLSVNAVIGIAILIIPSKNHN
jgi:hypothetical protein